MDSIQVSVITCLYNTPPKLFKKCLMSIHNQTFKNFEVLILNDGSSKYLDENKKIIESFNDERFKYFDTEHTGKSQTLNFGFKIAKGKYIAISDSDDQMYPERLEYQFNFLENNDYDVISNAVITDDNHIVFPTNVTESYEVTAKNLAYSTMHPCMMLNRKNVLAKVPFLFSQVYDSMEDCVFNFIMFYYGVTMWYDCNIMQIYSHNNENSVHYENIKLNLKKEYTRKITYRTFNYVNEYPPKTSAILLVNKRWGTDIEKTVLNIRMTSNNVNIIIVNYDNIEDLSYLNKYNVNFVELQDGQYSYNIAIQIAINNCDTKYCMIISKPCRFYTQDWDLLFERYYDSLEYPYKIMQPYIVGFDKIDENNYVNEHGKSKTNVRYGKQLNLFDKQIFTKLNELYFYSEYIFTADIPIIDDDLIFFSSIEYLKIFIGGLNVFDNDEFISAYISVSAILDWGGSSIFTDVNCGCINDNNIIYNYDDHIKKYNYYDNMLKFICFFCKESKYIYEKILYDAFDDKNIPLQIVENHIDNLDSFNKIKDFVIYGYDISYFLKKNNDKKRWRLTWKPY